jgi:hypothetical protein
LKSAKQAKRREQRLGGLALARFLEGVSVLGGILQERVNHQVRESSGRTRADQYAGTLVRRVLDVNIEPVTPFLADSVKNEAKAHKAGDPACHRSTNAIQKIQYTGTIYQHPSAS